MIYHIFANRSNIGDWLSAKGIQRLMAPMQITECLCDEPFIEETMAQLSKATNKDLVIIGGGGLLMDYFTPFWESFDSLSDKLSFVLWGVGFCDIKSEPSLPPIPLIEKIIEKSKLCVLRDLLSNSLLPNCKLPEPVSCPSLNYINEQEKHGNSILHAVNYTTVGVPAYETMCLASRTFAETTGLKYIETNNLVQKGNMSELDHVLEVYANSPIVISSALHGCIIGAAMGKKVIAVSGDRKIEGFMESVGLSDWVLDYTEAERLPQLLNQISLQKFPADSINMARKKNEKIAQSIKSIYTIK